MLTKLIEDFEDAAYQASMYKDDAALARVRAFTQAAEMARAYEPCDTCKGYGLVTIMDYDGYGSDADDQPCKDCNHA